MIDEKELAAVDKDKYLLLIRMYHLQFGPNATIRSILTLPRVPYGGRSII